MTTRIGVELRGGRHRTTVSTGLLRAQVVHSPPDRVRIGLLATTALLLGGDRVQLEIEVGPGCTVELFDVAGTVAYHGRGRAATWSSQAVVHEGARLRWGGEPLVVSDGAEVSRTTAVDLSEGAVALIRETLALGRQGEQGGNLQSRTLVRRVGQDVLLEDQRLMSPQRALPGMLGRHRVVDTVIALGLPAPVVSEDAGRYELVEKGSTLTRYLGQELARSPLHRLWADLTLTTPVRTPD